MAVFRSESAFLRVGFPPERFGLGEGWEEYFDEQGNPRKKRSPFPAVKFQMGEAEVDEETAKRLRAHDGFGTRFWEENPSDTEALSTLQLKPGATMPEGGLTPEDLDLLGRLKERAEVKALPPKVKDKLAEDFAAAVVRFQVHGIKAPKEGDGVAAVQVRARDLIELLEEHGITAYAEPKQADSGDSAGAD